MAGVPPATPVSNSAKPVSRSDLGVSGQGPFGHGLCQRSVDGQAVRARLHVPSPTLTMTQPVDPSNAEFERLQRQQAGAGPRSNTPGPRTRLNLLLSYGGWRSESWVDQLPRLLDPVGIHSIKVESGRQAEEVIRSTPVHIAVIDLRIPLEEQNDRARLEASGPRVLQILRRLHPAPPTIVVRAAQPMERERARGLAAALREGAYSVLDHPVRLETMLELLRRITRRYYADLWPA